MKNATNSSLKHKMKGTEHELIIMLVERILEIDKTDNSLNKAEKLQNTSLDVLLLIDEFKTKFEKLGEIAKEIAKKDGRTIVTYDDAEKALRQIRAEK